MVNPCSIFIVTKPMLKEQIPQMLGVLCEGVRLKRIPLRKEFAFNTSGRQPASVVSPPLSNRGVQKHEKKSKNCVQMLLYQGNKYLLISVN